MISLNEYMNSINKGNLNHNCDLNYVAVQNQNICINNKDVYEKTVDNNSCTASSKQNKKKIIKIGAIISAAILAIIAFLKRKEIGDFVKKIFNKNSFDDNPSKNPPNNHNFPHVKNDNNPTPLPSSTIAKKPLSSKVDKFKLPEPNFGSNPTLLEKQAYIDSIIQYTKYEDLELVNQALDAIRRYGSAEDLEKISYFAWVNADEPTLRNLIKTMGAIGNKETNYGAISNIFQNDNNTYSNETYIEAFKTIAKLTDVYGGYEDLLQFINKIPDDEDGEYTKILIETLIKVGDKKRIEYLDKYLRNYGHVNWYANNGKETPQVILDAIETIRKGLEKK